MSDVRYELHHDALEQTWEVHRVEVIGEFDSRAAARDFMVATTAQRKLRDQGSGELGFNELMQVAEQLLEHHYPKDLMEAFADDPGPKLTLALRECMEVMVRG